MNDDRSLHDNEDDYLRRFLLFSSLIQWAIHRDRKAVKEPIPSSEGPVRNRLEHGWSGDDIGWQPHTARKDKCRCWGHGGCGYRTHGFVALILKYYDEME